VTPHQARRRFAGTGLARLATGDAGGRPHIAPVRFAEDPEGRCALSLLADHYPRLAGRD